jgi:predicted transcriptional regulator
MNTNIESTVSEIMQRNVLTVEDDWPLNRLARFFIDHQISGAPVTDSEGNLVGVVSLTDIVRYDSMPESPATEHSTHEYYLHTLERQVTQEEMTNFHMEHESPATVRDIMTPMIFEVNENASIQEAADTMIKGHIHRLFVTREKRVFGIVTALDMLKVLRDDYGASDLARRA